jgi:hypothetical protein
MIPLIFFVVFFYYATKPAYVLVALPFVLFLVVRRSITFVVLLIAATVAGLFIDVDIFKDRQLVHPFLIPGVYFRAIYEKPYYKLHYIVGLSDQCETGPAVIIGSAWPWDFEYHIACGAFAADEESFDGKIQSKLSAFRPRKSPQCILLPPEAAYEIALLRDFREKGFAIKMDTLVYRTIFGRYDVTSRQTKSNVLIDDISVDLVRVN